jgi:hypothetical protein
LQRVQPPLVVVPLAPHGSGRFPAPDRVGEHLPEVWPPTTVGVVGSDAQGEGTQFQGCAEGDLTAFTRYGLPEGQVGEQLSHPAAMARVTVSIRLPSG